MEIVGVINPYGFDPLDNKSNYFSILDLTVVYEENGKFYVKYLNTGSMEVFLEKLSIAKTLEEKEIELELFLNGKRSSIGYRSVYEPIKNEYYYEEIPFCSSVFLPCYRKIDVFPKLLIEVNKKNNLNTFNVGVFFKDTQELVIGSYKFIYENKLKNISLKDKTVEEIKDIIVLLIKLGYLEEAKEIIQEVKENRKNYLETEEERIDNLLFVRSRTKDMNLHFF